MTAPDPGLIDLIAAHQLVSTATIFHRNGMVQRPECKCGELMHWAGAYPAHLALRVGQHANSRIAEVNARAKARVKAANKRASIRITEIRKEESARFEAEATIARVRGEVSAYSEIIPAVALADLRAALEGEQQ